MDLTPEYIKMCTKAVEIQLIKPRQKGDLYYLRIEQLSDGIINPEDIFEFYGCNGFGFGSSHKGGVCWHKNEGNTTEYYQDNYGGRRTKKIIWLPRQDQLQEMIKGDFIETCDYITHFSEKFVELKTPEKILLKIVMEENFNKTWNGEEWV
jgi:hypothetical protein